MFRFEDIKLGILPGMMIGYSFTAFLVNIAVMNLVDIFNPTMSVKMVVNLIASTVLTCVIISLAAAWILSALLRNIPFSDSIEASDNIAVDSTLSSVTLLISGTIIAFLFDASASTSVFIISGAAFMAGILGTVMGICRTPLVPAPANVLRDVPNNPLLAPEIDSNNVNSLCLQNQHVMQRNENSTVASDPVLSYFFKSSGCPGIDKDEEDNHSENSFLAASSFPAPQSMV